MAAHGIRDPGLLPRSGSLAQNHAFVDGNKRTGFAAMYTFLAINGAPLAADSEEIYNFVALLCEANQFSFEKLVP